MWFLKKGYDLYTNSNDGKKLSETKGSANITYGAIGLRLTTPIDSFDLKNTWDSVIKWGPNLYPDIV